ncbi:hypothetical protein TNCT1_11270 [Streptomyces sp. 1-11]|nr:hypothetical protein TNCT1_11270 [Streptomyces sp. 1-11]
MARQGAQKAVENWTSVAREPSSPPSSAAPSRLSSSRPRTRTLPLRRPRGTPWAPAATSAAARTFSQASVSTSVHGTAEIPVRRDVRRHGARHRPPRDGGATARPK